MGYEFEAPEHEDTGSNFLNVPGTYHLMVVGVDEAPVNKAGGVMAGFKIDCIVQGGDQPGQEDREIGILFFNGDYSHKDKGEFARLKQSRFLKATGVIGDFQPGQKTTVDLENAVGHHFIAKFEKQDKGDYMQLAGANIWHIDDPAVAPVPKNIGALKLLPAEHRRKPESFKRALPTKAGGREKDGGANMASL